MNHPTKKVKETPQAEKEEGDHQPTREWRRPTSTRGANQEGVGSGGWREERDQQRKKKEKEKKTEKVFFFLFFFLFFFFLSGAQNVIFFLASISLRSLNISDVKKQFWVPVSWGIPLGPLFFLSSLFYFVFSSSFFLIFLFPLFLSLLSPLLPSPSFCQGSKSVLFWGLNFVTIS